jgi:uncharacterized protein (DUF1800 family)
VPLPVYAGPFGAVQAERLLWRAGFGPRPGEEQALAKRGLDGAVKSLLFPQGAAKLTGKPPVVEGHGLFPQDKFGHDMLWWLDQMVRTDQPLVERMTFVWHDWFATSNQGVGSQRMMIDQIKMLRTSGLGSFRGLVYRVTQNPAMLLYLNGLNSLKGAPNENYARELMELFTLGHGAGYSERDVREQARALTGFTATWKDGPGWVRFKFDRNRHDDFMKVVFAKPGQFTWKQAVDLCLNHKQHPTFFCTKLWKYFIPTDPDPATLTELERTYRESGLNIRPVLEAILKHPALYEGPRMVKSPVLYLAGMLRRLEDQIENEDYVWLSIQAGQLLFYPPNVSGWNDQRWLDTSTFKARWDLAGRVLKKHSFDPEKARKGSAPADPESLVDKAAAFWGVQLTAQTRGALLDYAQKTMGAAIADDNRQRAFPPMAFNALRHLVAASPEMQTA